MNVYDKAHDLAKALKSDAIVVEYKKTKEQIKSDTELNKKLEAFKQKRIELQLKSFKEGTLNKEAEEEIKKEYQELLSNPLAVKYFEEEVKINVLVSDIQKIIYEDFKDIL